MYTLESIFRENVYVLIVIKKKSQWYTIEYHSVAFGTLGPFNDISVGLSGTLSGN